MSTVSENLYLLEVLVDNVTVASNDDPDIAVQVKFGDVGTFLIQRTSVHSTDPTDVDIADGKCLLFSMRPKKLQNYMEHHALHLSVLKMTTGEVQCVTKFPWDDSFLKMINEPAPAEPNAQFDTLDLMDKDNDERFIGFIDVLVRLSCHGKNIMSQFQRRMEPHRKDTPREKQEGMYHSDIAPLVPVISTVEVSEGLVIGMLPTDKPLTCFKERIKTPSTDVSEYFHPRDVLYEINQHLKTEKGKSVQEKFMPKAPLRPCIKSFIPIDYRIQKFLASDPQAFHPYVVEQAVKSYKEHGNKIHIYDPLDQVEELTTKAVTSRQDGQGEFEKTYGEHFKMNYAMNDNEDKELDEICKNCGGYGPVKDEKQVFMALGRPMLPASHFVCQGGGCKEYIKKRRAECIKATSCNEGVPCLPVPPCMEFNPCEYPKCLRGRPRGYSPCYLPPCPADRVCRPCKQAPWMGSPTKRARKKRSAPLSNSLIKEIDSKAESEGEQSKELADDDETSPATSVTKKKSKNRRRRKKCVGTCLSRGLDRYYNPRVRQGHIACVPELLTPQGVPPNMGWLWNIPNPGVNARPGWRPGAVHKKVYEIMCQLKNTNYVDSEELQTDFEIKKRNEEKAREKRLHPVTINLAQIEEPYVELRPDKNSTLKMAGAGKQMDHEPVKLDAEETKRREYLLRKTLTEVCRELCTNAYTDLYIRGRNLDLNRIPNNHRKIDLDPEKIFNALEGKTNSKPNSAKTFVIKEAPEKANFTTLSNNESDSSNKTKQQQKISNNKKRNRFQTNKKRQNYRYLIEEEPKQYTPQSEMPERDNHPQNNIQVFTPVLKSAALQEIIPVQKNDENLCICDYEQDFGEVQTNELDFTKIREIVPFDNKRTGIEASRNIEPNAVMKSGISVQPAVPAIVTGTNRTSQTGKKHHCKLKMQNEAQLFSEIDRILRIKEEAEACKQLMRRYIQDIDIARIAREKKFGKTEQNPVITSEADTEENDERSERELCIVLATPEPVIQNTVVSHFTLDQNQFMETSVKESPKPQNSSNKVPVQPRITPWLNRQNQRTSNSTFIKDNAAKTHSQQTKRVTIKNSNRTPCSKNPDQQLDKNNTIGKPKEKL